MDCNEWASSEPVQIVYWDIFNKQTNKDPLPLHMVQVVLMYLFLAWFELPQHIRREFDRSEIPYALASTVYYRVTIECVVYLAVMLSVLVLFSKYKIQNIPNSKSVKCCVVNAIWHSNISLPGYEAFIFRLFFRAQYNANMAPLINVITRMANATPDIHDVAQPPDDESPLQQHTKKIKRQNTHTKLLDIRKIADSKKQIWNLLWWTWNKRRIHIKCGWNAIWAQATRCLCCYSCCITSTWI